MKKSSKGNRLLGTGIIILAVYCLSIAATARDWHELGKLDEAGLKIKVDEFQERLKRESGDYDTLKGLGIACHMLAKSDPEKFGPLAVEALTRAWEMGPKDYEALCYLGSATTMMAQTTLNPVKKMSYANKGIALMDKAVRKAPDNVSVRLTRAYNSISLPSFLEREDIAVEDFEHLAAMIKRDPGSYGALKKEVQSRLAALYRKRNERAAADEMKIRAPGY
jgi:hypothetical protein